MSVPLTCPDIEIQFNTWVTNAQIGVRFNVFGIAVAVHDKENMMIVEDMCEDCNTGVVIHAGKNTPDEEGEPVVNGERTTVKKLEKECHKMGPKADKKLAAIEKKMLPKMIKAELKP